MKKEDTLNILTAMKKSYMALGIPDPEAVEALEMAINAVKAEPCEDSISRHSDYPIKSIEGEEIIERLENIAKHAIHEIGENPFILSLDDGIAVHEAIEIIKAEPWADAISRQAVLDCFTATKLKKFDFILYAREEIKKLPPVIPETKTGHWILTSDDDYEYCTCSKCGYQNGENWMIGSHIKFCQECGAKMVEPQERSK